jgi:hypothetical protein
MSGCQMRISRKIIQKSGLRHSCLLTLRRGRTTLVVLACFAIAAVGQAGRSRARSGRSQSTPKPDANSQGPRKGEPSSRSMRNGFRTQAARLVRGSSRRLISMRFGPANIRVINHRASSSAVIRLAVPNQKGRLLSLQRKAGLLSKRQALRLDRSLHIRTAASGRIESGASGKPDW